MKRIILAAPLILASCAGVPTSTTGDAIQCAAALTSAGITGGTNIIATLVTSIPSCTGLASDVIQAIITKSTAQAAAARRQMRLAP